MISKLYGLWMFPSEIDENSIPVAQCVALGSERVFNIEQGFKVGNELPDYTLLKMALVHDDSGAKHFTMSAGYEYAYPDTGETTILYNTVYSTANSWFGEDTNRLFELPEITQPLALLGFFEAFAKPIPYHQQLILTTTLSDIAAAIRSKTGKTDRILVKDFANEIRSIGEVVVDRDCDYYCTSGVRFTQALFAAELDITDVSDIVDCTVTPSGIINFERNLTDMECEFEAVGYGVADIQVDYIVGDYTYSRTFSVNVMRRENLALSLQTKAITPTTIDIPVTFDAGFDGLTQVIVRGDANLKPEIIKKDEVLFGITGTYEGAGGTSGENKVLKIAADNASYSITTEDLAGATKITDYAFYDRSKLTSIEMPNTITSIGKQSFYNCDAMTSVVLSNKVKTIGERAFYGCKKLTTLVFPSTLTSISNYAFQNCTGMTYYDFTACTGVPTLGTTVFSGIPSTCKIAVPMDLLAEWKVATNWSTYSSNIVGVGEGDAPTTGTVDISHGGDPAATASVFSFDLGMTWREFVASAYNIEWYNASTGSYVKHFSIDGDVVYYHNTNGPQEIVDTEDDAGTSGPDALIMERSYIAQDFGSL